VRTAQTCAFAFMIATDSFSPIGRPDEAVTASTRGIFRAALAWHLRLSGGSGFDQRGKFSSSMNTERIVTPAINQEH
jgi:hypothetical protein